jgi:glycosyltransferase involved in cell wall biosynthesis
MYLAAKKTGGKFLQAAASDTDLLSFYEQYNTQYKANFNLYTYLTVEIPNDLVTYYLMNRADLILLQHSGQDLLCRRFKSKRSIYPNIIDLDGFPSNKVNHGNYFVYVGAITSLKGSENLYNLIINLDRSVQVVIVGEPLDETSAKVVKELRDLPNVDYRGWLRHSEALELISEAKALINTSIHEGFPNIFLEAWAYGIPVISLRVDPGNVIVKHGLGAYCGGDLKEMKRCIEINETGSIDPKHLVSYVRTHHDFKTAGQRFEAILEPLP